MQLPHSRCTFAKGERAKKWPRISFQPSVRVHESGVNEPSRIKWRKESLTQSGRVVFHLSCDRNARETSVRFSVVQFEDATTIFSYRVCHFCRGCLRDVSFSLPLARSFLSCVSDSTKLACLRVDYSNVCGTCYEKGRCRNPRAACIVPLSRAPFGTCEKEWTKRK